MKNVKNLVKLLFNKVGLEVKYKNRSNSSYSQVRGLIRKCKATKLLDIGANIGQFADFVLGVDKNLQIFCVEPIPSAHKVLSKKYKNNNRVTILSPLVVSRKNGLTTLNVAKNSVSSSLLEMEPLHTKTAPGSEIVSQIDVEGLDLDTLFEKKLFNYTDQVESSRNWVIKIDAQGAEYEIIQGAKSCFKYISGFICELSLRELYTKQTLWLSFIKKMKLLGYEPFFLQTGFSDSKTSETLQIDVGFIHKSMT